MTGAAVPRLPLPAATPRALCALLLAAATALAVLPARADTPWVHAFAAYGEPKHPRGFDHFPYADPAAPKGGTLYLRNPDRRSSFDKYNTYTVRGNAPAGLAIFMHESLALLSGDEAMTMYGLLAEEMRIEPDFSAITFRLHPKARFSNGDPVLAEDVKYSYECLSGPQASPALQVAFAGVSRVVVEGERTIRFELKDRSRDMIFTMGALPVFSSKWGLGADGKHKKFDEIVTEYPITSGPYTIAAADSGRRIEFRRNPDYWAKDLPVRRGFFNFDRIVYRYYRDEAVATEAFKAGEFDIVTVYGQRTWHRLHKGPKWEDGRILKTQFDTATGQGMQAYQINLRRPIFQDIRVRKALVYSYDFETNNRYRLLKRANSLFNNSEFAAAGLPSPGELKLLEPYRKDLPPEVFGPPFVSPRTDSDQHALRRNLLEARRLLAEAGWKLAPDGRLRNARGQPFEFEYMTPSESGAAREAAWQRNLDKLGIRINVRNVDFALYSTRLDNYDFDMVTIAGTDFTLPSPADLLASFGSRSADEKGNVNLRGVKSPAVDHILDAMAKAQTLEALRDAARALDRVVTWNYWQVPELYSAAELASYWNKFGMPAQRPLYFAIDTVADRPAWPLVTWWIKPR